MTNLGGHPDLPSAIIPLLPRARHSSKSLTKNVGGGGFVLPAPTATPQIVLVALPGIGVDVFDLASGLKYGTLPVPDVKSLGHYWR